MPRCCPALFALWKSFRNDADSAFRRAAETDRLQIGIGDRIHPGIVIGMPRNPHCAAGREWAQATTLFLSFRQPWFSAGGFCSFVALRILL
jgi:hypothetical protein